MKNKLNFGGIFYLTCYDKYGNILWKDKTKNIVVDEGIQHILDCVFNLDGVVPYANYYIALASYAPMFVNTDTLTEAVAIEFTDYAEGIRQEFVKIRSASVISNVLSKAVFNINNSGVIGGSFITSADSGSTGLLMAGAAFANGNKTVVDGNRIEVQYDFTGAGS